METVPDERSYAVAMPAQNECDYIFRGDLQRLRCECAERSYGDWAGKSPAGPAHF
jgi:hypothetical protein